MCVCGPCCRMARCRQALACAPGDPSLALLSLFHAMTAALCRTYCSFLCQASSCATQASSVFITTCRVSPSSSLPLNGCFSGASDGRPCCESLRRPSTTSSSPSLFSVLRRSYQLVARVQPRVCVSFPCRSRVCTCADAYVVGSLSLAPCVLSCSRCDKSCHAHHTEPCPHTHLAQIRFLMMGRRKRCAGTEAVFCGGAHSRIHHLSARSCLPVCVSVCAPLAPVYRPIPSSSCPPSLSPAFSILAMAATPSFPLSPPHSIEQAEKDTATNGEKKRLPMCHVPFLCLCASATTTAASSSASRALARPRFGFIFPPSQ